MNDVALPQEPLPAEGLWTREKLAKSLVTADPPSPPKPKSMRITPFVVHVLKVLKAFPDANTSFLGELFFPDSPKHGWPKDQGGAATASTTCRMMRAGSGWTGKLERAGLIRRSWSKDAGTWHNDLTAAGETALANWPERCPYCGEPMGRHDAALECPSCARDGCCGPEWGCMPAGNNCMCPQCENEEEQEWREGIAVGEGP